MTTQDLIDDLEHAIDRYKALWFWQRWLDTLEHQCARHTLVIFYQQAAQLMQESYVCIAEFRRLHTLSEKALKLIGRKPD